MSHPEHLLISNVALPVMGINLSQRPTPPLSIEVTVRRPQNRDEKLSRAVSNLIPVALERRQGILVNKRDYGEYTVRVDPEVPCGTTLESRRPDSARQQQKPTLDPTDFQIREPEAVYLVL